MIIYNVTVGIDKDVEQEWLQWMKTKHIPDVLATGMFVENRIFKVLTEDAETVSYSIQYYARSIIEVDNYLTNFAPRLVEEHNQRYKNKHVAFRTLLESVD